MTKVETIKLGDKSYPFYVGLNALRFYKQETGVDLLPKLNSGFQLESEVIVGLTFAGIKEGLRRQNKPMKLKFEDVADLLDDNFDMIGEIFELLMKFPMFAGGGQKGK